MKHQKTSKNHAKPDYSLPKKAAVTGGSGFIGSHVVRLLVDAGVEVSVLLMHGDRGQLLDGMDVRRVRGDIASGEGLDSLLQGCDGLFHLAAIYALWLPRPAKMFEVNVEGTRAVLAAARKHGIRRVVYTSSIAAVGYKRGKAASDETTGFNAWDVADDYVLSKYVAELEAVAMAGPDFDVVCANPSFPLGHGDIGPTPTGRIVRDILAGKMPFSVGGGLNVVDVRDVAEGHLLAWKHGRSGQRYILGGENLPNKQLAKMICETAGKRAPLLTLPTAPLKALGRVAEQVSERVTKAPPMLTERSVAYTAGRYLYFDTNKARQELGYAPRSAAEAIASSVAWFSGFTGS